MITASQQIHIHKMKNGMTVLGEVMPWLESAAFSFSVPAGCQHDPADRLGLANFACEMVQRGAGSFDSRQFIEQLDSLGVDFGSSTSVFNAHFNGAMPAERLYDALAVYREVIRTPWLPNDQMEDARQVCVQEIRSLDDDLAQRVLLQLRLRQYGQPVGRWSQGTIEGVNAVDSSDIRSFVENHYQPNGMILTVAGNIDWPKLVESVESMFGDWTGKPVAPISESEKLHGTLHIPFDSQQAHIGIACPTLTYRDPDYFLARAATGVLSDGMSSRLFSELREKRGLCYSVFASLHSVLTQACVVAYVSTGSDRAQQSLDALVEQLVKLREGVTESELNRFKIQIRSSLVMQQESSRSRAGSMAGDWMHLGRVRTLNELTDVINGLTVERVNQFLNDHPYENFNLVTLGPEPLEMKNAVPQTST